MLCFASHVTPQAIQPRFRLEFERATVTFGEDARTIVARLEGGEEADYGAPDDTPQFKKLHDAIDAVRSPAPRIVCGPEAAAAQTLVVNGLHESAGEATPFPDSIVQRTEQQASVAGLDEVLLSCYERSRLPSEAGVAWAVPGRSVSLAGYRHFPSVELATRNDDIA